ncbi:MAG: large conductance mechanosensitive channel protein MscL [Dermabacter sp.]|nr:large conductance mechanosensitive channel protein MscL [Dermabacter sp.]
MDGFKKFIMQGNVLDLAVGVVIGGAFTALISAFVDHLINPVVAVFGGGNVDGFAYRIIGDNAATLVDFGAIISAVISFLITAAVVYFVFVLPVNRARDMDRKRRGVIDEEAPVSDDVALLTEIRDLLKANNQA